MRIFKRGKTYYLDVTYKGKRTRKAVGRNKKVAELALKDIEVKIAKEEFLGIFEDKRISFLDFGRDYLNYSRSNKAKSSFERDKSSVKHLTDFFGDVFLPDIKPEQIEHYKSFRREIVKPATVNRELACLSHMFTFAIKLGLVAHSPTEKMKKFKEPPGRLRFLSIEEIFGLVEASADHLKPIIITAVNTGMRKSEILNLNWNDVSFKNRSIIIRQSKNNEIRIIPINKMLFDSLFELYKNRIADRVFMRNGKPVKDIRTAFSNALKRSGIKDFRFHDLRHTFASHLVMNGTNLRTVQQLLGHKDIQMTMRYAHLSKDFVQDAVDHLGDKFKRCGTNMAQSDISQNEKFSKP